MTENLLRENFYTQVYSTVDISLLYHSAYTNQSSQNYNTPQLVTFMGYFYHGTWAGQRSIGKTLANGQNNKLAKKSLANK